MAGAKSYMTFGPVHQQVERDEQREQHPLLRLVRDSGPPTARHPRRIRVERLRAERRGEDVREDRHGVIARSAAGRRLDSQTRPSPAAIQARSRNRLTIAVYTPSAGSRPSRRNNTYREPSLVPTSKGTMKITFWISEVSPPMAYACR